MGFMKLKDAIACNPYNPKTGNKSAYARYLRYNVKGFYEKPNREVREIWLKEQNNEHTD